MKQIKLGLGLIVASLMFVGQASAYTPFAGVPIQGSAHDFVNTYLGEGGQTSPALNLCSTCHEMHRPAKMEALWGRQNPDAANAWAVQSHGSVHLLNDEDGTSYITAAGFVNATSGKCLSCHDGVSAIANGVTMAAGRANFGVDLTENHNIGRARSVNATTDMTVMAFNDQVEQADGSIKYYIGCGTCHTMHHTKKAKLVRDGSDGGSSTVCLNCHSTK